MTNRRDLLLGAAAAALFGAARADGAPRTVPVPRQRLAAAWRAASAPAGEPLDRVGIVAIDWQAAQVRIEADHPAPGRAHGILPLPDGGFLALATRPGRWLLRLDAQGAAVQRVALDAERPARTLGGHAELSADGQWLYTSETDPADDSGWIGVRSLRTLQREASFPSHGRDPHQLLRDDAGALWVANGGIPRLPDGRKRSLGEMAPSLVRLDAGSGALLAQQRLADPRLGIRHLAWAQGDQGRLGVALQAEHDEPGQRREAPVLAVLEDGQLRLASRDAQAEGYAGDIAAGPGGGFVVSGQKSGRGLWWHPQAAQLLRFAELTEPCALAAWDGARGVLLGGVRGIARWHLDDAPRMLAWPQPMAPDNHWRLLAPA